MLVRIVTSQGTRCCRRSSAHCVEHDLAAPGPENGPIPPSLIASEPLFSLAGATQVLTEALATYNLSTIYSTIFAQFAAAAALNVSYSMLCDPSDLSEIARITTNGVLFR